jgi:hypothetical protein
MNRGLGIGLYLLLVLFTGCEKKTSITGKVTYNGTPVENGYIAFSPQGKGQTLASPVTNGDYSIAEAAPGKYTVVAIGSKKINHYTTSAEAYANAAKNPGHIAEATDYIAQDAKGNSKSVDVASGEQSFDFAITGPPIPGTGK